MTDPATPATPATTTFKPWGMELKSFLMLMHLSQLLSFVVPLGGLVMPIVMWATNKDKSAEVDAHGKVILNWVISELIYAIVAAVLCLVFIGFLLLAALGICGLVFCVLGGIKANEGTLWKYPMSITFFKPTPAV